MCDGDVERKRPTDVAHGVIRRIRPLRVEREREEPAVAALAPLERLVALGDDELGTDGVGGGREDVRPEGGARGDGGAGELDAERACACGGVIAGWTEKRWFRTYIGER